MITAKKGDACAEFKGVGGYLLLVLELPIGGGDQKRNGFKP